MKRILFIASSPLCHDGLTKVIMNIVRYSNKSNFFFGIVLRDDTAHEFFQFFKEQHAMIHIIYKTKKHILSYMNAIRKIVSKNHYDIIYVHGNSALMFFDIFPGILGGAKKRIAHCHNSASNMPWLHLLLKPIFNLCLSYKISCSDLAGKWAFFGKYKVMKNGICISEYSFDEKARTDFRHKLQIGDALLIGHVGRFNKQKNHLFLIHIFEEIKKKHANAKLLLIGDGELEKEIKLLVSECGLSESIIFYGITDEVNYLMMAMDVFLLPSLFEGLPIVGVEAQATGLPCVVADTISKDLKITDRVTFLSLEKPPEYWADCVLKEVVADRQIYAELVRNKGYDIIDSVKKLNELF